MTATHETLPLLSLVVLTPLAGAALVWLARSQRQARAIALGVMGVDLLLALAVLARFDSASAAFQLVERAVWIPTLNVHYLVGVDGISVLFLPLTAALFAGTVIASWTSVRTMPRLYYALVLLLASATLTASVQRAVADAGMTEGAALVYVPHTTAGVTINENADPSVSATSSKV